MRSWHLAATFAAAAMVTSLALLLVAMALPWLAESARIFVVATGSLLAAFIVAGLWDGLTCQVEATRRDTRPLLSVHPRRRG